MSPDAKSYKTITAEEPQRILLQNGHERFNPNLLTGSLQAKAHLCQPVHVGSGLLEPPIMRGLQSDILLVKTLFRVGDKVCIPGTSLKGAFRSLIEMFTNSCAPGDDSDEFRGCKPGEADSTELCPACRLFGAFGFLGNVRFDDVVFPTKIRSSMKMLPPQYNSGKGRQHGERRYYPHDLVDERDGNWPFEVLDPGQSFEIKVSFKNISSEDLGLLLIGLGQGEWQICPKLGGGKSAGLGSVRITELRGQLLDIRASYASFESQYLPFVPEAHIKEAQDFLEVGVLEELAENLGWKLLREQCDEK